MVTLSGILRMPPRIKVLEALGAIADGRVKCLDPECKAAEVVSSEGDRKYRVYVDASRGVAFSDDNGTRFRGYIGYPIIALLMLQRRLPFDERIAEALKGIPWRRLNETLKRYVLVENEVLKIASQRGVAPEEVKTFVDRVYHELRRLKLRRLSSPPLMP